MGFLGVLATLGLLAFILFRSLHNAQTARDSLGVFIILGVVGVYFFHMVVNVAMVIGFFPVIGIPLPFMSYGGSSVSDGVYRSRSCNQCSPATLRELKSAVL